MELDTGSALTILPASITAILWTPFCMRGLTIRNRVFYEWKQKNLGWAPSSDPTTTILAPWLSATPCSMYKKKKTSKSLSLPELEPFQKFTIPLENLQFHWKYVSL